jgi:predicted HTH domain antitoxin
MNTLTFQLPDEMINKLKSRSAQTIDDQARIALAIDLFMHKEISLGKAAEYIQISIQEMIQVLKARGIPAFIYDDKTFNEDLDAIQKYQDLTEQPE